MRGIQTNVSAISKILALARMRVRCTRDETPDAQVFPEGRASFFSAMARKLASGQLVAHHEFNPPTDQPSERNADSLSTEATPGAAQAALSASCFSAHERTVPFNVTLLPSTSTVIR